MAVSTSAIALRAKTGCKTCRKRRRKCDETRPSCLYCTASKRQCIWPSDDELVDGRFTIARARANGNKTWNALSRDGKHGLHADAHVSHVAISSCLESAVGQHFNDIYFSLLINPDSHPDFHRDWINDIQATMTTNMGVRYSVLANAASNLYLSGGAVQMQEVALGYYSTSLRGLNQVVTQASPTSPNDRNMILTSMMMLYLHGCMGHGTYSDIPLHVNAAKRMIDLNYLTSIDAESQTSLKSPFDRLAVESVIYQVFLSRMGLWSTEAHESNEPLHRSFDPQFWMSCEALLSRSLPFPEQSGTCNSPVLGMPFALYKIMVMIKKLWEAAAPSKAFRKTLRSLQVEISTWEDSILPSQDQTNTNMTVVTPSTETITQDATALMILSASLLLQHLAYSESRSRPRPPEADAWQIQQIVAILERRAGDTGWLTCYLGNYPLYVAGHFMRTSREIALVRDELRLRYQYMAFSMVDRFAKDLEVAWRSAQDVVMDEV